MKRQHAKAYSDDTLGQRAREVIKYPHDVYDRPWERDEWIKEQFRNEALTSIDELVPEILDMLDEQGRPYSQRLKLSWRIKPFVLPRTVEAWPVASWIMDLNWYRNNSETGGLTLASDAYRRVYVFLLATGDLVMSNRLHGNDPDTRIYTAPKHKRLVYGKETRRDNHEGTLHAPKTANRMWDQEFAMLINSGICRFYKLLRDGPEANV